VGVWLFELYGPEINSFDRFCSIIFVDEVYVCI